MPDDCFCMKLRVAWIFQFYLGVFEYRNHIYIYIWFSPKFESCLGTNNRQFLADLVLFVWVVKTILMFSLKIENIILTKTTFYENTTFKICNLSTLQNITMFE